MTKAAVKAMDTATDFLANLPAGAVRISNFIVTGASKRGWTTWITAAVDPRVMAIAPIVIDVLNVERSFEHHWRAYGFWAPAVQDYAAAGIMNWLGTPQMSALLEIEDPYRYRDRLALPKYEINSTGDQFFLPDSAQFYFRDLPGEKYLRYVPNTDHGMGSPEAVANLSAWLQAVTQNFPRPRFSWWGDRGAGTLTVRTVSPATKVMLWRATNPKARDFRLESLGPAWTGEPVAGERGIYKVSVPAPDKGWTAYFIELSFPGPGDLPLVFTTEVFVSPDVYPFEAPVLAAPGAYSLPVFSSSAFNWR
jgi:PhoPQ-activated pathogenicity-related protein